MFSDSSYGILLNQKADKKFKLVEEFSLTSGKLYRENPMIFGEIVSRINAEENRSLSPAELNGITLITTAVQIVLFNFWQSQSSNMNSKLQQALVDTFGSYHLDNLNQQYENSFTLIDNDSAKTQYYPELITTWLTNQNNAFRNYTLLFSDKELEQDIPYQSIMKKIESFFDRDEYADNGAENIIERLRKPALLYPDSIESQLQYIRESWHDLPEDFLSIILTGLDKFKEEQIFNWGGPGPVETLRFDYGEDEYERFSEDSDWMPHLVLLAKSTYVWLDQLSKKYNHSINRLDEIPEEELLELSKRGFTGIWFIGLWERSEASRRVKHMMGNHEAIASAYSLHDYAIAYALGGEEALQTLRYKASKYNLRIGCDMVPNHTGLDSKWMKEHPEWYLQIPYQPYPNYSFNSEDLSSDAEFSVHIEDHYFDKTDASVVFKYYSHRDKQTRYIYHGNDGTGIPWNDTAQLNYLLPEVREAIINMIISIAKTFPIIRFDAAMTLAKKHIQRLWFPEPGSGGDIPTRSDFGLTKAEFDQHMPIEFWREVVDRVAEEAPNTLLLAEAFWMMEGYFVRTLGMHRVYNSAFMHMLKDEDNAKYRQSIFNIIEFNPQILKRFVNFMSNPDEETAIDQFGTDDKYFGVCIVMATMPGLPMFAHGQIEGFTEKYGMEFNKARLDETVNKYLVERHEREIFPLLRKRIIFSEVDNFLLFDFQSVHNYVDENVFVYSNNNNGQFSLVAYHNKFAETKGYVRFANTTRPAGDAREWFQTTLAAAMGIEELHDRYILFDDAISRLTYIRRVEQIRQEGLYLELGAFKYNVFINLRIVEDHDGKLNQLHDYLNGSGTSNLDYSLKQIKLEPFIKEFLDYVSPMILQTLLEPEQKINPSFFKELNFRAEKFLEFAGDFTESDANIIENHIDTGLRLIRSHFLNKNIPLEKMTFYVALEKTAFIQKHLLFDKPNTWVDDLLIKETLQEIPEYNSPLLDILQPLVTFRNRFCCDKFSLGKAIFQLFTDKDIKQFLEVHTFEDTLWFSKERMDTLIEMIDTISYALAPSADFDRRGVNTRIRLLNKAAVKSNYRFLDFIEILKE